MYKVNPEHAGKVEFDFGSDVGTRKLTQGLPQELLKRVHELPGGSYYVTYEPPKKNEVQP
ncbi:hypothetical protein [Runella salmonicolor]|uniref:KTSC domain-containing protein n=1 Tax=Runella salmonicolor TaxID=2950278 RepID=A0ABT1FRR3_9BACT|nr:hypothetical protein [Runella salmonicolor]MCP1384456.1 hypothetical protein [Runella salmonicolor]